MSISKFAAAYHEKMFPGYQSDFLRTDPEFIERFDNFAFDEVINQEGQQLEKLDWHGKKVMALMTHEGSGLGGCERDLKRICEGASFGKGLAVHGADASRSESTVASWAKAQV